MQFEITAKKEEKTKVRLSEYQKRLEKKLKDRKEKR